MKLIAPDFLLQSHDIIFRWKKKIYIYSMNKIASNRSLKWLTIHEIISIDESVLWKIVSNVISILRE